MYNINMENNIKRIRDNIYIKSKTQDIGGGASKPAVGFIMFLWMEIRG